MFYLSKLSKLSKFSSLFNFVYNLSTISVSICNKCSFFAIKQCHALP